MPSASTAKPEKPSSSEVQDPIKQGIVFVEHKIRNLVKKKGRLDAYREIQNSGKELDADQKQALKKYDELCQNLTFAQELSKHLSTVSQENLKYLKKKEKKEAYEKEQQEIAKVKEILIIQDVLASMGTENVREDFLAGRNRACKLTETELGYLDELFAEVSPKREIEDNQPSFPEQAQNAAKHLLNIVEGKEKEIVGTKYNILKEIIEKINICGYFDPSSPEVVDTQESSPQAIPVQVEPVEEVHVETEEIPAEAVPNATFQPREPVPVEPAVAPVMETAGLYISQRPMADVLTNVMGPGPTTFSFIQESELEVAEVSVVPPPVPAALPIPTQTFTNANFSPQKEVMYNAPYNPATAQPTPTPSQTFEASTFQNSQEEGAGDWAESNPEQNDWALAVEQSEQNRWSEPAQQTDEWSENTNDDGFQTAGRGGSKGGRGRGGGSDRGRGGYRGGRGNYQNGRGNYNQNGRGGYNRSNEGGYQNGYQPRGDGERNYRDRDYNRDNREYNRDNRDYNKDRDYNREGGGRGRGGPRGGGQDRGGPRGAPRGGGMRGNNPRGGTRGNRQ